MADNRYQIKEIEYLANQQPSADLFWEVYEHITSTLQRDLARGQHRSPTQPASRLSRWIDAEISGHHGDALAYAGAKHPKQMAEQGRRVVVGSM